MKKQLPKKGLSSRSGRAPSKRQAVRPPLLTKPVLNVLDRLPVSFWIEDFSRAKHRLDHLRNSGVSDLKKHLEKQPRELLNLAEMVRILWVNNETMDIYQAEDRATLIKNFNLVFSKETYEVFKDMIIAFAGGETDFRREAINLTIRGRKMSILFHARVDPSSKHDLSRVYVAIVDLTSLRLSVDDLQRSEAVYRQVFESAMVPMVMVDARTGIIVDANPAVHQFIGSSAEPIIGRSITQLCPENESERCAELLKKSVRGKMTAVDDLHICRSGGEDACVMASASTLNTESGTYILLVFSPVEGGVSPWDRRMKVDRRALSTVKAKLSERERLILTMIASGHSNKSISERLTISMKTVESHRRNIMQKLDIHKATDLVRFALTSGLITSD